MVRQPGSTLSTISGRVAPQVSRRLWRPRKHGTFEAPGTNHDGPLVRRSTSEYEGYFHSRLAQAPYLGSDVLLMGHSTCPASSPSSLLDGALSVSDSRSTIPENLGDSPARCSGITSPLHLVPTGLLVSLYCCQIFWSFDVGIGSKVFVSDEDGRCVVLRYGVFR